MDVSRRWFLSGAGACAAAAAIPLPALPDMSLLAPYHVVTGPPIFDGAIGTYNGVIIRESFDLRVCAREALAAW